MAALDKRHEFVLLFDVKNGNPNGDPDQGNMPRTDPETGRGFVTDVALKRKIRNYVALVRDGDEGHDIYVREKAVLNRQHDRAYRELDLPMGKNAKGRTADHVDQATEWLCANFFDIRTFGAVMSTGDNPGGQVRGPVQIAFAESLDPVLPVEVSITRMAVTNEADADKERTMGEKHIVPYGLYRAHGFVSAHLARKTGFSTDDLGLLWQALANMFEHDRSAARGEMATRALVVFEHASDLGEAPAHKLFDLVRVSRAGEVAVPPRSFADYVVQVDEAAAPGGVTIHRLV